MELFRRIAGKSVHKLNEYCCKLLQERGRVYMFHSIGDERHDMSLSTAAFEFFLQSIKQQPIIRLEEWQNHSDFACFTFDDVPDSFYYNALPLLKKYRMPFTIFVSCSLLNTEGFITTEMLKEIAECELCTIGSHGWKHSFFADFNREEAESDLRNSKEQLGELTQRIIDIYAFPYGSVYACGMGNKRIVGQNYKYGFGTIATPITKPSLLPIYYLPRIAVTEGNYKVIIEKICRRK